MFLSLVPTPGGSGGSGGSDAGGRGGMSPGTLGLLIFLASLSILFIASLALYLVARFRSEVWPQAGVWNVVGGLALSTAIMLASSGTMHLALRAARRGRPQALRMAMLLTTLLAVTFLVCQVRVWLALPAQGMQAQRNLFAWLFFALTGLHGAHVVGGIIPLVWVSVGSFRGRYTPQAHDGVRNCALYWHFLDGVWLVMLSVMLVAG